MVWIRKSNVCQMKRMRKLIGASFSRARLERMNELLKIMTTTARETTVVLSSTSRLEVTGDDMAKEFSAIEELLKLRILYSEENTLF
jgi:hypothetical protein